MRAHTGVWISHARPFCLLADSFSLAVDSSAFFYLRLSFLAGSCGFSAFTGHFLPPFKFRFIRPFDFLTCWFVISKKGRTSPLNIYLRCLNLFRIYELSWKQKQKQRTCGCHPNILSARLLLPWALHAIAVLTCTPRIICLHVSFGIFDRANLLVLNNFNFKICVSCVCEIKISLDYSSTRWRKSPSWSFYLLILMTYIKAT